MSSRDYRNRVRPAYFSGFRPYCLPLGDEIPPLARYEDVLEQHERLAAVIASLASAFPSIYALLANDESMADFADADAATSRSTLYDTLNELLKNITNAEAKLASGDLNYLDLTPIHQQLFSGARGPSGTNWQDANNQRVAMDVIHSHESHAFWVSIGLASLAAAAFVVASIATFGTATFFVAAGLGLAAGGYQAYRSWDRYGTFSAASKTALSDDSMLITQAQVNGALAAAVIDTALIFLDAYSIGVKGVRALSAADKLLAAPKAVLPEIAGAETVRVSGNEYIEALGHTFPGRFLEEIPRAVDEIGLEAARRAVRDPRFIAAAARRNWALAGTFFHSTARQVGDQAVLNGVLPAGWRFDFELTIQAGRGGSRLDVFLRGPAGEFLEVDWKTTGRSAMKSLDEMAKHSRQLTSNLGVVLTGQQSQSWVELTRAEWQNLLRDNPQQANALLQGASAAINWP